MLSEVIRSGMSLHIEKSPIHRVLLPSAMNTTFLKIHRTYLKEMIFEKENVRLEVLRISESRLKRVPPTVVHLTAVRTIEITNSPIEAVSLNIFGKLPRLEQLNLSRNKILMLHVSGSGDDYFPNLREIYLLHNQLTTVSLHSFSGIKKLESLDLQRNRIVRVQGPFVSDSLKSLDLSGNRLTTLYCCGWNLSNLVFFAVNDNRLTWLPTCLVQAMPDIDYLGLKSNVLVDGNIWNVFELKKMKRLDLSFNKLTSAVFSCVLPALDMLYLSNNRITRLSIPVAGKGLKIMASYNLIDTFDPKSLSPNITMLEMFCNPIDCSFNKAVMRKDEEVQCIKQDQKFKLFGIFESSRQNVDTTLIVKMSAVRSFVLENGATLKSIEFKNTYLSSVQFGMNCSLKNLTIKRSKLSQLPTSIHHLKDLNELTISNSLIQAFNLDVISELPRLTILDLGRNRIHSLYCTVEKVMTTMVTVVYLGKNRLRSINMDLFNAMKSLEKIDLSQNLISIWNWNPREEGTFVLNHIPPTHGWLELHNLMIFSTTSKLFGIFESSRHDMETSLVVIMSTLRNFVLENGATFKSIELKNTYLSSMQFGMNCSVTNLRIQRSKLSHLPKSIHQLTNLIKFTMSHSHVQVVNLNGISGLPRLLLLDLTRNRIHSVYCTPEKDIFPMLAEVYLRDNRLRSINMNLFGVMKSLQKLDLSHNLISVMSGSLVSSGLAVLDLSFNQLLSFDCCNWMLPNLYNLVATDNRLISLPRCIALAIVNVAHIDLSNNQLRPDALYVIRSRLKQSTPVLGYYYFFFKQHQLYGLVLEQTYVSNVWFEENNTYLEKLTINYNRLKSVPATMIHLAHIKNIGITGSRIQSIDFGLFAKLQRLENLNLNYNIIKDLDYSTMTGEDFPQLRELYLSFNRLKTVNIKHFNAMPALEELYLSNNQIIRVQGPLVAHSLKFLDLSQNLIATLSCCNWTVSSLVNVLLLNNTLVQLPTCMEETMVNVKYLHLASNALSSDSGFWNRLVSMKSLHVLDISYNKITSVTLDIALPSLQHLNLQNNRVTDISVTTATYGLSININCNLIAQFDPANVTRNVTTFTMHCNPLDCSRDKTWNKEQMSGERNECMINDSTCKECHT
uniref:Uncharacterized protein n=1 Tax=Anopheles minimus TaxID=112268 RepID=A0A182W6Y3_9DIPT